MLFLEIIAVCSENPTKHVSTLCGENARFLSVAADPSSYHGLLTADRISFPLKVFEMTV